jgi:hypothetical protein
MVGTCITLIWFRTGIGGGRCERGNELGFIKCGRLNDQLKIGAS